LRDSFRLLVAARSLLAFHRADPVRDLFSLVHTHIVHLRAPDPFLAPVNYIFTTSDRDADYEASYRPPNTTRSLGGLSELPTWIDPDEAAYEIRHRGKIMSVQCLLE
jgi:hypothetical protein